MKKLTKQSLAKIIQSKGINAAKAAVKKSVKNAVAQIKTLQGEVDGANAILGQAMSLAFSESGIAAPKRKKRAKKKAGRKAKKKVRKAKRGRKKAAGKVTKKKAARKVTKKKTAKKTAKKKAGKNITEGNLNKLLSIVTKGGISSGKAGDVFAYPQKYAATKKALIKANKIISKKMVRKGDQRKKEYLFLP